MKIELINDNQMKILLNQMDLIERDIKITELSYGSEKIQELFQEMLEEASSQYGVDFRNNPLMIEAIPVSLNSIMIIVTKVTESGDLVSKLESYASPLADFLKSRIQDIGKKVGFESIEDLLNMHLNKVGSTEEIKKELLPHTLGYIFGSLDIAASASALTKDLIKGDSQLFKRDGFYHLLLDTKGYEIIELNRIDSTLGEFGKRYPASYLVKYFFAEHCETILASNAIEKLAQI